MTTSFESKPYRIGSTVFPGLSKLQEEMNELGQILSRIIEAGGLDHWSGHQAEPLIEEIGDVIATVNYFISRNFSEQAADRVRERARLKETTYSVWEDEVRNA